MLDKQFPVTIAEDGLLGRIIRILFNTTGKWEDFQINKDYPADGYVNITFYEDHDDYVGVTERVFVSDSFRVSDYLVTSSQEKDQVTLICVPKSLFARPRMTLREIAEFQESRFPASEVRFFLTCTNEEGVVVSVHAFRTSREAELAMRRSYNAELDDCKNTKRHIISHDCHETYAAINCGPQWEYYWQIFETKIS